MLSHLFSWTAALLLAVLFGTNAQALDINEDAVAFLQKLGEQNQEIHTFCANFVQVKKVATLNRTLSSKGYICLRKAEAQAANTPQSQSSENVRPATDALLFAYTKPVSSGFIFRQGKGNLWQENPRKTFVATIPGQSVVVAIAEHIYALLVANPTNLLANYNVSPANTKAASLHFTPYRQTTFAQIEALYHREDGGLRNISLREANGDSVEITFQGVHINDILPRHCEMYLH